MLKAVALGAPDEAAGMVAAAQRPEDLMQIDPYIAGLLQQRAALASARVEAHEIECGLRAILDLRAQAAIGQPLHTREINVLIGAEIHPHWLGNTA
jgi:hypothetical protein